MIRKNIFYYSNHRHLFLFFKRNSCCLIGLIFFALLVYGINPVNAQNYTPVKNIVEFKRLYAEKSAGMNTLKSDFIQEKSISMLKNKIISEGIFIYKKDSRLRMEYTKPYTYLFLMDSDKIVIKNSQKTSGVSANSNKLFKMISRMTIDCVTGNILNSKEYTIKVSENSKNYYLDLVPRQKLIKSLFDRIDILISKTDFTVDRIEMKESSGDNTVLIFSNKRINNPVSDEVFKAN
jgi:outer membrane lipoprotein-sorting protein